MMKANREQIDAKSLMEKWGDVFLGKQVLQDIQLSSMADFEAPGHGRMARELFKQIKDSNATYACESKILLSYNML